ncbi:MAG TPA: SH3 domain-containing protein [Anaerolineales bacterium]|nr:SH3 domain-containing protein [Anaerolineales bacterium]
MTRLSAPRYDLFKLLVTIVLVIILILLLLRDGATTPAATLPAETDPVSSATTELTSLAPSESAMTSLAPSETPPAESTPTSAATDTTLNSTPTSPSASTATQASTNVALTSASPAADETASCNTRLPSRLSIGQRARVAQRLNLRTAPSIDAPVLQTNAVDTTVEIFGGPVCTPVGERAYLWWQVRLFDGAEGWSAETQLNEPAYLLQPIP